MAGFSNGHFPLEKPRAMISRHRSPSLDVPKSPLSEPALDHFSPKLVEQILTKENLLLYGSTAPIVSGSVENARIVGGQKKILHAYPPSSLVRPSTRFKVNPAFVDENSDLDVSADVPSSVINGPQIGAKSTSPKRACISNREGTTRGRLALSSPQLALLSSQTTGGSSSNRVCPSQQSPASPTSASAVKSLVAYEENVAPDSYCPTPSPSFEVVRIYPGCGEEFSEPTSVPPLLNPSRSRKGSSQPSVGPNSSLDPRFEEVVLTSLAWMFAFTGVLGLLILLAAWTDNLYACSLMVFLSLNLGAYLVMNKWSTKQIPISRFREPVDVVIRGVDLESAGFDCPEDGHSSVVHINGRFEISSLQSSQDIFQSELLMNGQVISVCWLPSIKTIFHSKIRSLLLAGMFFMLEHRR